MSHIEKILFYGMQAIKLSRLEKPTGYMLVFIPCLWGALMASHGRPHLSTLILLFLGAVIMRSAGCTYNDFVDRDLDKLVRRTKSRPLACHAVSSRFALALIGGQLFLGLLVLLALPPHVFLLACGALPIVALYPWMKRLTHWPQLVLGLAFNWGVFIGWSAEAGTLHGAAYILYAAGVFWTLGYDTLYAHQDREDDLMAGIKSTAVFFKGHSKMFLHGCYSLKWLCLAGAGYVQGMPWIFYSLLVLFAMVTGVYLERLDLTSPKACLRAFKANQYLGLAIAVLIYLGVTLR